MTEEQTQALQQNEATTIPENDKMIIDLFDKPKIISITGSVHSGKSMVFYHIYETLKKYANFNLYTYGFAREMKGAQQIYSLEELETIESSIIMLDEVNSLFDLDRQSNKPEIESSLRLINHRNNILVIGATPDTLKKFLANKVNLYIFKKCIFGEFIQGSYAKRIAMGYTGTERGSRILGVPVDKAIVYDGKKYSHLHIDYWPEYDSKADNESIIKLKEDVG